VVNNLHDRYFQQLPGPSFATILPEPSFATTYLNLLFLQSFVQPSVLVFLITGFCLRPSISLVSLPSATSAVTMVLSSFLLLVATSLVADGLAKAIPSRYGVTLEEAGSHNFSVTQVRNTRFVGHGHGPLARAKAYRKYGVPVPEELASVVSRLLSKRTTGSAVTTPEGSDVEFLTLVSIGSP
jgi:hypothetical protein